jgi:hypothetical protein
MIEMSRSLEQIFPQTWDLLGSKEKSVLLPRFIAEWGADRPHFLPMLLREQGRPPEIVETADYEYLRFWAASQEEPEVVGEEWVINPTAQVIRLDSACSVLEKEPGLYLIYRSSAGVRDYRLDFQEAKILDRLKSDVRFQLAELSDTERGVLENLSQQEIVFGKTQGS